MQLQHCEIVCCTPMPKFSLAVLLVAFSTLEPKGGFCLPGKRVGLKTTGPPSLPGCFPLAAL